jgi:hypothetical protein
LGYCISARHAPEQSNNASQSSERNIPIRLIRLRIAMRGVAWRRCLAGERYAYDMLSALLLLLTTPAAECRVPAAQVVNVARASGPIALDGRLDEGTWHAAEALTRFYEVYPTQLGAPPVRTEARMLHDDHHLYVGVRAHDPDPAAIRSSLMRRDQSFDAQDYVELLIDPLNTRKNAWLFRTNPHGVQADGQYDESARARYYSPDLDFDVRTIVDEEGWTAEFRIPLATLRYGAEGAGAWAVAIYRHWPRATTVSIASIPVPRAASCLLCFAGEVTGFTLNARPAAASVTPYAALARREGASADPSTRARFGIDAKWQPRPDTVVDVTVQPDFSQVEADSPQLIANTRFALSVPEKRPFFLEGIDLFALPIPVVYTRAFTDPKAGVRITRRGGAHEFSGLLLRDAGDGSVLEPGATASRAGLQDFESTGLVGRYERHDGASTLGAVASARVNDDGSHNTVVGVDAEWTLSDSGRLTAQLLQSDTVNPDRPDLLSAWTGQHLVGTAGKLEWIHLTDRGYGSLSASSLSGGFRAWNGFVTQVGISSVSALGGLYFYPRSPVLTRISPLVSLAQAETTGGDRVSRRVAPAIHIQAAHDTDVTVTWSHDEEGITALGHRRFDSLSISLSTSPLTWMPGASVSYASGETLDLATGDVVPVQSWRATFPVRFERLDMSASAAHQALADRLTERTLRVNGVWHFSTRLYAQAIHQAASLTTQSSRASSDLTSLLVSYQTNWQTRYFVGFRQSDGLTREREIFAKFSYVFSR